MSPLPLVSIGIPTFNRPAGLREVLICMTSQTYPNLQIIIGDNCSDNEEVARVVDEFIQDSRIVYYRHEKNMGATYNFQFVLDKAEGEYFMWAADDDRFSLNYIEQNLKNIQSNEKTIGSFGNLCSIDGKSVSQEQYQPSNKNKKYIRIRSFLGNPSFNMCFYSLFKSSVIKSFQIKRFDFYGGDWFMVAFLLKLGNIANTKDTTIYRGDKGLSSDHLKLLKHFYEHSFFKYIPFFKPTIFYLSIDFLSAICCMDILLYYNFYYANYSLEQFAPNKYAGIKWFYKKMMKFFNYVIYFGNKYLFHSRTAQFLNVDPS